MLRIIEHSFLVMLICNNLSKFCRIVHFDQYYVANISFVIFFLPAFKAQRAKASSSCCFDTLPSESSCLRVLRPDFFGTGMSFLDVGFRSFALHTASPKDTFAAGNARTGDWRYTSCSFLKRCNDYGNDFTSFYSGSVGDVELRCVYDWC